jgi:hypothetical protein
VPVAANIEATNDNIKSIAVAEDIILFLKYLIFHFLHMQVGIVDTLIKLVEKTEFDTPPP